MEEEVNKNKKTNNNAAFFQLQLQVEKKTKSPFWRQKLKIDSKPA